MLSLSKYAVLYPVKNMKQKKYHHGNLKNTLIQVGIKILAEEGIGALSLRKVAKNAGVSHAAPYAHFKDKRALIAAMATEGHTRIYEKNSEIIEVFADMPLQQLVKTACAYLDFGMDNPDLFRITFSGVVERERDYPALVEITQKNFEILREIALRCQAEGIFDADDADLLAVSLWGTVHGLVSLILQGQISGEVLAHNSPRKLLLFSLNQMTRVEVGAGL